MPSVTDSFQRYVSSISQKYSYEETSEMGYRTDFENLLKEIFEAINVTRFDHDANASQGNKPDFVIRKNNIPILYIETKDIGVSLDKIENSEQMSRYFGYKNLILTDYCEFRFYRNGLPYGEPIKIAEYNKYSRSIRPLDNNYDNLRQTLLDFAVTSKEPIRSGKHLAKIMGGKAQRIRDNIHLFLDKGAEGNEEIEKVYKSIKKLLVHDLTLNDFADMYAQTLVYGLFVARYYDESPENFTRQEARDLIPKTNPFLRHFFDHIVGPSFDKRLKYIVDELCEVFTHADVHELMKEYFKEDLWGDVYSGPDPVIHFYEDFLKEYDPVLRKKMGAYYTPKPVVHFITYSVDQILKKHFGLIDGIADISKLNDGTHRVQVLDPATGTGTFIGAVIGAIYGFICAKRQQGRWPTYVHNDLLPRIHGFELMMAPYTIAHLKLAMAFGQTGFKYFNRRLGIYLTNTLDKSSTQEGLFSTFGFAESIANESKEAAVIKNKTPIMVVIGNPPYSGESSNKQYSGNDVYKVEPIGGKLKEKNSKWLNDDYVKFIRYAESMVEKTGEGIVAMITAHGYIDNPTFRGMRWHLMNTFDEIYVLDLHGNSNKKEKVPNGGVDNNVFDIKTGVAIIFAIKKSGVKNGLAKIHKADLYGKRSVKFEFLNTHKIDNVDWMDITPTAPNYEWIQKDVELEKAYNVGFSLDELFKLKNTGIVTKRDKLCIQYCPADVWKSAEDFLNLPESIVKEKYKIPKDVRDWKYSWAKADLVSTGPTEKNIAPVSYRPFDTRFIYYTGNSRGFIGWPVERISKHYVGKENIGLLITKACADATYQHIFVTKYTSEVIFLSGITASNAINAPLYIYEEDGSKTSNLNEKVTREIRKSLGEISDEDILFYVYAVLFSISYRKKYLNFLKRGYPRIPYPRNIGIFKKLTKLGNELIHLHLLDSPLVNDLITSYPVTGTNQIDRVPEFKDGKVFINDKQYFGGISKSVWDFYIGGYQPAQKWLKDRKGRTLNDEDLLHYQKIISALTETITIMEKIEEVCGANCET